MSQDGISLTISSEALEAITNRIMEKLEVRLKPLITTRENGDDVIWDARGCADYLGVCEKWVKDRKGKYNLPFIQVGGYIRYRKSQIDRWIEEQTINPIPRGKHR